MTKERLIKNISNIPISELGEISSDAEINYVMEIIKESYEAAPDK